MIDIGTLPGSEANEPVYRVILSRYPQIHLFESVPRLQDWEVLYAVESLTNPRLRDTVMVLFGLWRPSPIRLWTVAAVALIAISVPIIASLTSRLLSLSLP